MEVRFIGKKCYEIRSMDVISPQRLALLQFSCTRLIKTFTRSSSLKTTRRNEGGGVGAWSSPVFTETECFRSHQFTVHPCWPRKTCVQTIFHPLSKNRKLLQNDCRNLNLTAIIANQNNINRRAKTFKAKTNITCRKIRDIIQERLKTT